jgi:hypothetical protein
MAIDLRPLLDKAFYKEQPVKNATLSIEKAADDFARRTNTDGVSFEVVAPTDADEAWVHRMLLRPLVYFCESEGRPIPRCAGVFLSLFVGDALYCISGADVIGWVNEQLGLSADELRSRYGTHELETAQR